MPRAKKQKLVERDPVELFAIHWEELSNLKDRLNGNHMSPIKRRKLEKRAKRLEEELIPRVTETLAAIANAAKTFQRV